jgi:hypothetical protein
MKLFTPGAPFEFIAMDLLGPLPKTTSGNQYVMVIMDRYTKFSVAIPMKETTAGQSAMLYLIRGSPTLVCRWSCYLIMARNLLPGSRECSLMCLV